MDMRNGVRVMIMQEAYSYRTMFEACASSALPPPTDHSRAGTLAVQGLRQSEGYLVVFCVLLHPPAVNERDRPARRSCPAGPPMPWVPTFQPLLAFPSRRPAELSCPRLPGGDHRRLSERLIL